MGLGASQPPCLGVQAREGMGCGRIQKDALDSAAQGGGARRGRAMPLLQLPEPLLVRQGELGDDDGLCAPREIVPSSTRAC